MEAGKPIGLLDLVKLGAVVTVYVTCPFCEGRGEDCGSCEGTGTYEQDVGLRDLLLAARKLLLVSKTADSRRAEGAK